MDIGNGFRQMDEEMITRWARQSRQVFNVVRRHARSDLHAWVLVAALTHSWATEACLQGAPSNLSSKWLTKHLGQNGPEGLKNRKPSREPVMKGQLDHLHGMGIHSLRDMSYKQATDLIDSAFAEHWAGKWY